MGSLDKGKLTFVVAVFALLAIFPFVGGSYGVDLVTKIMIYAIFALSLELLVGVTGLVSLGHAAFLGIGAYVTKIHYELARSDLKIGRDEGRARAPSQLGIDAAEKALSASIKAAAIPVKGHDEIAQVASISAADPAIGDLIASVFDKTGKDGVITVEESKSMDFETEYVEGMQFDRG